MTATSMMYFDSAARGSQFYQDIPTFAIHAGSSMGALWDSWDCQTPGDFKQIMNIVNPQVPVFLAMPRYYASKYFQPKAQYSSVSVNGFKPQRGSSGLETGQGYMTGNPVTMVLHNVMVRNVTPIMQWSKLPIPPQVQKNHLEKAIGRETYIPSQIEMLVEWGEVV